MRAAFVQQPGPADSLLVGELPQPVPQGSQVLVQIVASAVNPIDTYLRSGTIAMDLPLPFIPGCDLAGKVVAVGPDASQFAVGDRVWGSNQGLFDRQGTLGEFAAVEECWLYPTPELVSDEAAAAGALVGITAHLGLFREAKLVAGETLFVNGGTGGVGSAVVQMAKAVGARVITTGGSDAKVAACLELGADYAVNYRTQDISEAVAKFAPDGVHVWWDVRREPDFDMAVTHLQERGRMVVMAGRDARPELPLGSFYLKELRLSGFVMFKATPDEQRACADDINSWLVEGKYQPRIDRVLPLADAAIAHQLQEESTISSSGALAGKIVVRMA